MKIDEQLKAAAEHPDDPDGDEGPRYRLRDAAFALSDLPPIEWIIEKLISAGSVSVFYGEPGSKKTYSVLSLAVCVALGKPWLGLAVTPRRVLVVDEESGERRMALRLGAVLRGEFGSAETPIYFVSLAGFKLDDKGDVPELQKLIESTRAELVIVDALADIMTGDENSKQDTQPVFTALRRIAETTGAAIIVVHHSNKAGGYRGSSAIKGALDLMVKIESDEASNWVTFKSEKTRDSEGVQFAAVATWTDSQFYLSQAEPKIKEKQLNKSQVYVMRHLEQNGESTIADIMAAADTCSPEAARKAVYGLADLGKIHRTNPGNGGRGILATYAITETEDDDEQDNSDDD